MALSPFAALSLPLAQDATWRESAAGFGERLRAQMQDTAFSDGFQEKWQKVRVCAAQYAGGLSGFSVVGSALCSCNVSPHKGIVCATLPSSYTWQQKQRHYTKRNK